MKNNKTQKPNKIYSEKFLKLYDLVKAREKALRIKEYNFKLRLLIALFLSICLMSTYFFKIQFENLINFRPTTSSYESGLYVHFIDVGQGKAIAISTNNGTNILIDCGRQSEGNKLFGYLEQYFFVGGNAEKVFDYFILTHSDNDHIGNSVKIFEKYEIRNCYRPKIFTPAEAELRGITNQNQINNTLLYSNFVDALNNENCNVFYNFSGESIAGPNYNFLFLTPMQDAYSNSNSYSPIIKLTYNYFFNSAEMSATSSQKHSKNFIFTGDATLANESEIFSTFNANILKADVLDVSHHGSNTSSGQNFLNAIKPTYAVISVGKNNYNLPSDDVLERLLLSGVEFENILRTDQLGNIIFHISPFGSLNVFNQTISYLNISNYTFVEILISLEMFILLISFLIYIPPKKQLI